MNIKSTAVVLLIATAVTGCAKDVTPPPYIAQPVLSADMVHALSTKDLNLCAINSGINGLDDNGGLCSDWLQQQLEKKAIKPEDETTALQIAQAQSASIQARESRQQASEAISAADSRQEKSDSKAGWRTLLAVTMLCGSKPWGC